MKSINRNRALIIAAMIAVVLGIYPSYLYVSRRVRAAKAERDFVQAGLGYAFFEYSDFKCGIIFEGKRVTDESLAILQEYPQVEYLQFSFTPNVTDAGLAHLRQCRKLRSVFIDGCPQITDEGLRALKGLPGLYAIMVLDSPLGDASLATFASLPKLESLTLSGNFTDDGLKHLAGCRFVEHLTLRRTHLSGSGFSHFSPGGELKHLEVSSDAPRFTLKEIGRLESLESLHVYHCKIVKAEFDHLTQLKNLKKVQSIPLASEWWD